MSTNKYLAKIQADFDAGVAAGVNSTSTIFLNGEIIGGLKDYADYRVKIERALAEVGG
jgi:protein-disulfide isomerase